MLRKAVLLTMLLAVVVWLAGCNTVQGVGEDITWVGEKGAEVFE
jgi:predicted small secreted protein